MRRGTSSLGTDVPSEREINRLAARSDEEFWLFEKMDEERRQKENYRSRLMEELEVPEWVYSTRNKDDKAKSFENDVASITGKRRRREVAYADTLSDIQWMKAVENGEDISRLSGRGRRRESLNLPGVSDSLASNNSEEAEKKLSGSRNENVPTVSEGTSEETFGSTPKRYRTEAGSAMKAEYSGTAGTSWSGQIASWNSHRKRRSNYAMQSSSSDSRGQNSNGRNGWT